MRQPELGTIPHDHLFTRTVDATPVHFVRPLDTDRPTWAAYENSRYLGTVHAQPEAGQLWHVQSTRERHLRLDDAVRALRRPPSWPSQRDTARQWASRLLRDPQLLVLNLQTTGLNRSWAVQIGLTDRYGTPLLNQLINPRAAITPCASALHGITAVQTALSPAFSELVPELAHLLHGRRCVTYNAVFDREVMERELYRHFADGRRTRDWLANCVWEDTMRPYATWKGLWAAHRRAYRYQPLGGQYDAITNCQLLLAILHVISS